VATLAVARTAAPVADAGALPGRPRGELYVVGLGPGDPSMRTTRAREALLAAEDWVGYDLYLDLAADLSAGKRLHPFPLGAEEERVRHAIRLAAQGRRVALLCSGDAAIYAMASPVFELLRREEEGWDDFARRIAVEVVPGITALQAASAKAGALIGHDFCAVSLSDLLTPWPVIERRLRAAAEGGFVTALYNPKSRRRTTQLERALAIFRAHRPPETPVIIATNVGRATERVTVTTLAEVDTAMVDMLSIVLIGAPESRFVTANGRRMAYTPRGYAEKRREDETP
jgi:cobalt-precorrin 5A hydrolase/precorrin-3B C17-methyltransferase